MKAVIGYRFSVTRLAIFIAALLLLPTAAHGLAIAPGQAETLFSPSEQKSFDFELINNDDRPANIEVYAKGELAGSVVVNGPAKFLMQAHESRRIRFNVNFPDSAKLPSTISIISKATAKSDGSNNIITANIALEFKLHVISKQGQQKATSAGTAVGTLDAEKASFSAAEIEIVDVRFENVGKETAKLIIDAKNTGSADIDVSAEVNFGSGNGAAERFAKAEPVKITGMATRRLITHIDVRGVPQGSYDVEVLLKYANKVKRQMVKLQVIESGYFNSPAYIYIILGALIAFNIVFVVLIAGKFKK